MRNNNVMQESLPLFHNEFNNQMRCFPSTRYQGSKLKLLPWLYDSLKSLEFDSVLDAFGGTGSVGYMLKAAGKQVTYNDLLRFNLYAGKALIENSCEQLTDNDIDFLLSKHPNIVYSTFIEQTFHNIYFTDEENRWLDMISANILRLTNDYKKALAYFALGQACIIKRPYNLFHRKNLYIRLSDVKRSFGNKKTWDTPFEVHFRKFVNEANCSVFNNGRDNRSINYDIFDLENNFFDLVYIDTPYISSHGVGVDYYHFYHFLEGLVDYENWPERVDLNNNHRKLKGNANVWVDKKKIYGAFDDLFSKFRNCKIAVSYRANGIPEDFEILNLLKKYKPDVSEIKRKDYRYVLSTNGTQELLFIAQ